MMNRFFVTTKAERSYEVDMEDKEIIDLYWKRKEDAIVMTEQKYGKYCYQIAMHIVHGREDAKECVNDTWLKAWESIPPNRPNRLSVYLGKITRNLALDRLKYYETKKRNRGQAPLALEEFSDCIADSAKFRQMEDVELEEILDVFLRDLPEMNRKIFLRRYWYFDSVKEIARGYGITRSRVKMSLMRTREQLRKRLEQEEVFVKRKRIK